jgi:hypothetical protein
VDADYARRIVIGALLVPIIRKHRFQAFEPQPLDLGRHLDTRLDPLFNGWLIEKQEMDRQ